MTEQPNNTTHDDILTIPYPYGCTYPKIFHFTISVPLNTNLDDKHITKSIERRTNNVPQRMRDMLEDIVDYLKDIPDDRLMEYCKLKIFDDRGDTDATK